MVPMPGNDRTRFKLLGKYEQMFRATGLRPDLQDEFRAGQRYAFARTASANVAFILLHDGRFDFLAHRAGS